MCTQMCVDVCAARALARSHSVCLLPRQGNTGGSKPTSGERGLPPVAGPGSRDQENRWKQYLEDERIALFLQNEEFMKELQRNRDFLLALERGGAPGVVPRSLLWWGRGLELALALGLR